MLYFQRKLRNKKKRLLSLKILASYLSMCHLHKITYMCPFLFPKQMFANIPLKGIVHSKSKFHPFTTRRFANADAFPKPRNPSRVLQLEKNSTLV